METSWTCTARRLVDSRLSSPGFFSSYSLFFFFFFFCFLFFLPLYHRLTRLAKRLLLIYTHSFPESYGVAAYTYSQLCCIAMQHTALSLHLSFFLHPLYLILLALFFILLLFYMSILFFGPEDPSSISHSLVHYYTTSSKQRLNMYTGQKYVYLCTAVHRYIFTSYILGFF